MKNLFLIDLNKDKSKISPYLSETLIEQIKKSLKNGKKTLLYINKRGFSELLICSDCNHIYKCPKCDISMHLHKNPPLLLCHHCSFFKEIPISCEKCQSVNLNKIGVGIEQIQEKIQTIFPGKNIFRMDSDNVKNINDKKNAVSNMTKADIIIGTKMITTGFDFSFLDTIGIVLLEQELQVPNYKTEENIYANIKQLIGRGGRKGADANIIIQTYIPKNEIIQNIINLNYKEFFLGVLKERKLFSYPPFFELATLQYKNEKKDDAFLFLSVLKEKLDLLNKDQTKEIILVDNAFKRDNKYYSRIIIKGHDLRFFLDQYKNIFLKTKDLTITFE